MPKIQEYTPRVGATVTPSVSVPAPGRARARGLQRLGQGLQQLGGAAQQVVEQNELSDITAKLAQAQAGITEQWQETVRTSEPGDPNVAENFMEQVDEQLGTIGENLETNRGRRHYNTTIARMRANFQTTAAAGQAELAGIKASNDYNNTLDGLSSGLINDPSSLDLARQMHEDTINGLKESGRLPAKMLSKFREEGSDFLTKSAVRGWINIEPQFALDNLNQGRWDKDLNADTKVQLISESKTAIRAADLEGSRQSKAERDAKKAAQQATQNEFLEKLTNGELSTKDVLASNLDPVGSGSKKQFLDMIRTQLKGPGAADPGTVNELFRRIHLPDGAPGKITDESELNEFFGKGVDKTYLDYLRKEVSGLKTTEGRNEAAVTKSFINSARAQITKSNLMTNTVDPIGDNNFLMFQLDFQNALAEGKKAGKSVRAMLDPRSSDYIGNVKDRYFRTDLQKMRDQLNFNLQAPPKVDEPKPSQPEVVPRKTGESAAAYLKRIGK